MAYKGKTTCRILKDIRRQIAEANDIDLVIKECTYQGDCAGTCPRCEAEVAYLERELAKRRALGKAACITGIATSALLGVPAAAQTCATDSIAPMVNTLEDVDTMQIRGLVQDKNGMPLVGCNVILKNNVKIGTITSYDGDFEMKIPHAELASLEFVCMGYEKKTLPVEPLMLITLEDDSSAYETVTTGIVPDGTLYQEGLINSPVHADSIPIKVAPKKNKK